MSSSIILLILLSAFMHALWNYIIKRCVTNGPALVFVISSFDALILLPITLYLIYGQGINIPITGYLFIFGSGILHSLYFVLLANGYRVGDLSIVYPVARGAGPLLASIGAVLLFGERPSMLLFLGTVAISAGVIFLTGDPRKSKGSSAISSGIVYGLLTGSAVAAYTLWDAYAMQGLLISPIIYQGGAGLTRMLCMTPYAVTHRAEVLQVWHDDKVRAFIIAALSVGAYLLILIVLKFAPVTYVAPMRTLSILLGVLMGANLLKEKDPTRRLAAASGIVVGVIMLNIG